MTKRRRLKRVASKNNWAGAQARQSGLTTSDTGSNPSGLHVIIGNYGNSVLSTIFATLIGISARLIKVTTEKSPWSWTGGVLLTKVVLLWRYGFEYFFKILFIYTFYNCIVPVGFLPWKIRVVFPGERQLRQSRAAQPTVHAGCFSVSIICWTLTWTRGS